MVKARRVRGAQGRFTAGEFPVLCLSRIGQEGHNLQSAPVSAISTSRGSRPASSSGSGGPPGRARGAQVQTYIPYIRGAGIEHVVSVLAPRGGEHHQILDSFEGVAAAERTVATQLGRDHRPGRRQKDDAG